MSQTASRRIGLSRGFPFCRPLSSLAHTHDDRNQDCSLQGPRRLPHMSPATISFVNSCISIIITGKYSVAFSIVSILICTIYSDLQDQFFLLFRLGLVPCTWQLPRSIFLSSTHSHRSSCDVTATTLHLGPCLHSVFCGGEKNLTYSHIHNFSVMQKET